MWLAGAFRELQRNKANGGLRGKIGGGHCCIWVDRQASFVLEGAENSSGRFPKLDIDPSKGIKVGLQNPGAVDGSGWGRVVDALEVFLSCSWV